MPKEAELLTSALEKRAADSTGSKTASHVMLSARVIDGCIDQVVYERNDTGAVAQEASTASDLVEHGVEAETESGILHG